jgi:ABC-type sulfate transport system permease component
MCTARAVSEFGAVVIVAYHPMTAPVMIYERFTAYGLKYSQPVAVWLILVCLVLFLLLQGLLTETQGGGMIRIDQAQCPPARDFPWGLWT